MAEQIQMLFAAHVAEVVAISAGLAIVVAVRGYGRRHEAATRKRGARLLD